MKIKGKKFKFTKKSVIFLAVAVLVIICIAFACSASSKAQSAHMNVTCSALKKTNIQDTISVSGTIHSQNSHNVYTAQAYPVAKISASVGDKVKKGDILAVLDTASLEKDLETQQYTVQSASKSASITLQQAKASYENTLYLYNHDLNSDIASARLQLDTAKSALQTEKNTYNYDKSSYDSGQLSKMELDQEAGKLNQAQATYDSAAKSMSAAQRKAQQDLKTAQGTYEDAVGKTEDKSQQATLEKLQQSLNDCIITAPADGTVTVSNAAVGTVPTGTLFKVEDTDDLMADMEIKEIDTKRLKVGDKAVITTDVTGDKKIAATVTNVAPAATQKTEGTSNVTFAVKVSITGKDPALKIGMEAKANIVLDEKDDIYVIPYDSLIQKADGSCAVMVAEKTGFLYNAKEIPVKTGMETDVSVEISGAGLKDGMLVISSPDGVKSGDSVQPASSSSASDVGVG